MLIIFSHTKEKLLHVLIALHAAGVSVPEIWADGHVAQSVHWQNALQFSPDM